MLCAAARSSHDGYCVLPLLLVVAAKRGPDVPAGKSQEDPGYLDKIEYVLVQCIVAAVRVTGGGEQKRCLCLSYWFAKYILLRNPFFLPPSGPENGRNKLNHGFVRVRARR